MSSTSSARENMWALAHRLREEGRIGAAAETAFALWKSLPSDRAVTLAVLAFLKECGAHDRASPIAWDARLRWTNDAQIEAEVGEIAIALGEFDEAATALRKAVSLDPNQGASWLRLAYCQRFTDENADVERFRRAWADARLDAVAHTCVGFALGKALDDLGDYAHASQVLSQANAEARRTAIWRDTDWRRLVDAQRDAPSLPTLDTDTSFVPIFIVGMPRSGTTLVARALAQHTEVRDRGELNWIPALHSLLSEQGRLQDRQALAAIARVIRAQMQRDDAPVRFYIDKNPLNFRYLDFIAACFPNAKIVHCRRGVRDTALSIWMQHFAHEDLGFAYDFTSIAEVEGNCAMLMTHWRSRLPLQVLDIDYEDFVGDPDQEKRRLADFLCLPRDAADVPAVDRPSIVTTASVWQVRQPVYKHAVGRWRNYAPHLPELITLFPERT